MGTPGGKIHGCPLCHVFAWDGEKAARVAVLTPYQHNDTVYPVTWVDVPAKVRICTCGLPEHNRHHQGSPVDPIKHPDSVPEDQQRGLELDE